MWTLWMWLPGETEMQSGIEFIKLALEGSTGLRAMSVMALGGSWY